MGNGQSASSLTGCAITYTQVIRHVHPEKQMSGKDHGANRDSVVVKILSPTTAVIGVADGAGLLYWSEVASRIASEKFTNYFEQFVKSNPSVDEVKFHMKQAILYVNKELINWCHPKTNEKVQILDLGGQTTLGGFFVFKLNSKDSKHYKSEWGACCVGTGDSPSFKFSPKSEGHGVYTTMFKDDGQMLPFYGLEAHNINDPTFETALINDYFFATSDGVCDSFPDRNPPIVHRDYQTDLKTATNFIVNKTLESHKNNKLDPDDVTIGSIQIVPNTPELASRKYPYTVAVEDRTTEFFPDFTLSVELPWGGYSYPLLKSGN